MSLIPISIIVLCVTALGTILPELRNYVELRSQADRVCRGHAEKLVAAYERIRAGNRGLAELRLQCKIAQADAVYLPAATVELGALSRGIVLAQNIQDKLIQHHFDFIQVPSQIIRPPAEVIPSESELIPHAIELIPHPADLVPATDTFIPTETRDTGPNPRSNFAHLEREAGGACGIAGDLRIPCQNSALFQHQSDIAGFQVRCSGEQIFWSYHLQKSVGLP